MQKKKKKKKTEIEKEMKEIERQHFLSKKNLELKKKRKWKQPKTLKEKED